MSRLRFTPDHKVAILLELTGGRPAREVSRRYGVTIRTLYRWRAKRAHQQQVEEQERLRLLEAAHRRLKKQYAELTLDYATLRAALIRDVQGDC